MALMSKLTFDFEGNKDNQALVAEKEQTQDSLSFLDTEHQILAQRLIEQKFIIFQWPDAPRRRFPQKIGRTTHIHFFHKLFCAGKTSLGDISIGDYAQLDDKRPVGVSKNSENFFIQFLQKLFKTNVPNQNNWYDKKGNSTYLFST